jgi:predicted metal-dependent hydrolase
MFNRDAVTSPSTSKQSRSQVVDDEFGVVTCRRSAQARFVRIRVADDGTVRASLPKRAPLYLVRELLDSSRLEIRKLVDSQKARRATYVNGMAVGRSHRLVLRYDMIDMPHKKLSGQELIITLPLSYRDQTDDAQAFISQQVNRVLRREATAYLPRRLRYLADTFGFEYERERFASQSGRWGSCSSRGTISLNVALMNLPLELIDYVLIHELAHTKQMNHSPAFWQLVQDCMPDYTVHRKMLKKQNPSH